MLKEIVELLERELPLLVERPWLASIALFIAGIVLVAAWLMTAWRLGKWYYGRQIELLKAENGWLRQLVEYQERQLRAAGGTRGKRP